MRFEHLVQINDPLMPLLTPLTRAQLWRGLLRRAEQPTEFVLGLEGYALRARGATTAGAWLERQLDFGNFAVEDRVELTTLVGSFTRTAAGPGWPASTLAIQIEEPQPEALYLRFTYEFDDGAANDEDAGAEAAQTLALRQQAYFSADLDTVQRIRELAEAGALDG
ncbi:MAG: AtaL-like protein [Betaproteobacteria bacterium]